MTSGVDAHPRSELTEVGRILRALEYWGAALESQSGTMVWIDRPQRGCYVRSRDILRIEPEFRGKQVWSAVTVRCPDGSVETLFDQRRPKIVQNALQKAEMAATAALALALASQGGA